MNYLITYLILGAVIAWCARAERRRLEREAAREALARAQVTYPQLPWTQADADAEWRRVLHAIREEPCESYAWGAPALERLATGADEHVPCLPVEVTDFDLWAAELEDQR